jgi:hypothetical protein
MRTRPQCARAGLPEIDFIVCGRIEDPGTLNKPGSLVKQCSECNADVRVHPSTLKANWKAPIVCMQCALAIIGSEEEMWRDGMRLNQSGTAIEKW